jgi:hypothetical protein
MRAGVQKRARQFHHVDIVAAPECHVAYLVALGMMVAAQADAMRVARLYPHATCPAYANVRALNRALATA